MEENLNMGGKYSTGVIGKKLTAIDTIIHVLYYIIVMDNALYHHAGIITDYAFLPPYSQELNPIERVWKLVKKHATHNRYFQLLSDLKGALSDEFNRHFKPNEELRKLCVIT